MNLPSRRPQITEEIMWGDHRLHLSIGFVPDGGPPREVFLKGFKCGSDQDELLDDMMIILSHALQSGLSPIQMSRNKALGHSVAKLVIDRLAAAWPPNELFPPRDTP